MIYFKELFNDRKREIEEFISLMVFLERKSDEKRPNEDITFFQSFFYSTDDGISISYQSMINIMKSNVALMIYNIIEFTVSGLIDVIYDAIRNQELSYMDVNDNIQQLWRKTVLSPAKDPSANYNTFLRKSEEMIDYILNKKTLDLQTRNFLRAGNLDGVEIKKTLEAHGVRFNPSRDNYRPEKLTQIKTKRNELAHGAISFTEALRDRAIMDISEDNDIIFSFLEDLIKTVEHYHDNEEYKCAN
ncbi:MAG: MAE_28990/MAE_18760 family HEPN-like nuclease [Tissierellia bacterium]|nr:MAE_28990/MAE_18760 family HEPN-like nuclease [Tissierellia bacterium]